jgi:hypothetical protein
MEAPTASKRSRNLSASCRLISFLTVCGAASMKSLAAGSSRPTVSRTSFTAHELYDADLAVADIDQHRV